MNQSPAKGVLEVSSSRGTSGSSALRGGVSKVQACRTQRGAAPATTAEGLDADRSLLLMVTKICNYRLACVKMTQFRLSIHCRENKSFTVHSSAQMTMPSTRAHT